MMKHQLLAVACLCCLLSIFYPAAGARQHTVTGAATAAGLTSTVLVKLSSSICDEGTGAVSGDALAAAMQQAAAQGLTFPQALPTRCWYALQQQQQTGGSSRVGVAAVASGANNTASFDGLLSSGSFQFAQTDKPRPVFTPITTPADSVLTSSSIRPAVSAAAAVGASSVPAECPGGSCPFLWGMNRIAMQSLWLKPGLIPFPSGFTKRGSIIDTGVDFTHADMIGMNGQLQVDKARSATFNRAGNLPVQGASNLNLTSGSFTGHGTHVAGIMAGGWGNGDTRGIAGLLGPTSGGVVMCNAFSPGSYFSSSMVQVGASTQDLLSCYNYARSVDAHWVVNLSLGGPGTMSEMALERDTLKQTICDNGGMAVVAAGNEGLDISASGRDASGYQYDGAYPAKFATLYPDCVLAVAAVDSSDRLATFSNWGSAVGVAAPGVSILSDVPSRYADTSGTNVWASATWSGTSMATPHVAAAALLIRNAFPTATAAQVIRCIKSTSLAQPVKPAIGDTAGVKRIAGGILNAAAAFDCVKAAVQPTPPPSPSPSPAPTLLTTSPASPSASAIIQPNPSPSPSPRPSPSPSRSPSPSPRPSPSPSPRPSPSPSPRPSPSPSPRPSPSPSPRPSPSLSPSPSPNPSLRLSPSPSPAPGAGVKLTCPSSGLPVCVNEGSGAQPPAGSSRCPSSKPYSMTVRASSGNSRITCCYEFRPAGYVCKASTGSCVADAVCRGGSGTCPRNARISNCSG